MFICDACTDISGELVLANNKAALPKVAKAMGVGGEIDLAALGVKPRFSKLTFQRKAGHIFYLCPFSEPCNTIYQDHVRPVAKAKGFTIDRADEIYGTQPIIEDIWEGINSAELIIADVTGRNPNVMYEIGMAHTVGKPVVIITQSIDDVPFDLRHHRCIVYSHTPRGCTELEEKIAGTLTFLRSRT